MLNDLERKSELWLKLKKHYEERLAQMRRKNDNDLNERDTAELRGRIKEIKELLDMERVPDPQEPPDTGVRL